MTALTSMSMQHASHIRTFNNSDRLKRYRSVAEPVIGNSFFGGGVLGVNVVRREAANNHEARCPASAQPQRMDARLNSEK